LLRKAMPMNKKPSRYNLACQSLADTITERQQIKEKLEKNNSVKAEGPLLRELDGANRALESAFSEAYDAKRAEDAYWEGME